MNNLSNEIVHISKVLEKQIPKGYHEIVTEYIRQNIVGGVFSVLEIAVILLVLYLIVRLLIHAVKNKDGFYYDEMGVSFLGFLTSFGVVIVSVILIIAIFYDLESAAGNIQHAVAPNYYLIKSFIK